MICEISLSVSDYVRYITNSKIPGMNFDVNFDGIFTFLKSLSKLVTKWSWTFVLTRHQNHNYVIKSTYYGTYAKIQRIEFDVLYSTAIYCIIVFLCVHFPVPFLSYQMALFEFKSFNFFLLPSTIILKLLMWYLLLAIFIFGSKIILM